MEWVWRLQGTEPGPFFLCTKFNTSKTKSEGWRWQVLMIKHYRGPFWFATAFTVVRAGDDAAKMINYIMALIMFETAWQGWRPCSQNYKWYHGIN